MNSQRSWAIGNDPPYVCAYAPTRSSKPHPWAPPPDPRFKPGPVVVASGGVNKKIIFHLPTRHVSTTGSENMFSRGKNRTMHEPSRSHRAVSQPPSLKPRRLRLAAASAPIVRDLEFERLPRQGNLQTQAAPD